MTTAARSLACLLLLIGGNAAAMAASQPPCFVRSALRIYAYAPFAGPGQGQADFDSGVSATGPTFAPGTLTNYGPSTVSTITASAFADYGSLRLVGAGNALASVGATFQLTTMAGFQFVDRVTVTSASLPIGTPVQLRGDLQLTGYANVVGARPLRSFFARLETNQHGTVVEFNNATGSTSNVIQTTVGATLVVTGRLNAQVGDTAVAGGNGATASLDVDLAADMELVSLTPGALLLFCSGASYDHTLAQSRPVGVGCGTGPPRLTSTAPVLGVTCTFHMMGAAPGQPVAFGLAVGGPTYAPMGSCALLLEPDPRVLTLESRGFSDAAGNWTMGFTVPNAAGLVGVVMSCQNLVLVANGPFLGIGELTNAVRLRLGF
ncbi:MAG: hypothetical protein IPK26_15460 [Planctomycetes bacterium]|nr:hypothetical protein [Planctomycetota bacterium]